MASVISYKQKIRRFKKKAQAEIYNPYNEFFVNIADLPCDYLISVGNLHKALLSFTYKVACHAEHMYAIENKTENKADNAVRVTDKYSDLINNWLASVIDVNKVKISQSSFNEDFLTGYLMAKLLLPSVLANATSLHHGYSKGLIHGIMSAIHTVEWTMCHAGFAMVDHVKNDNVKNIIICNGMTSENGDITSLECTQSVRNQITDILQHKLAFYICDILPAKHIGLYNAFIIAVMDVSNDGFSMIRLPDLTTWLTAELINFLLLCCVAFDNVQLFKTPWLSSKRHTNKYYVILKNKNKRFSLANYNNLLKYIEAIANGSTAVYYNKYALPLIDDFIQAIIVKVNALIAFTDSLSVSDINALWLEKIIKNN